MNRTSIFAAGLLLLALNGPHATARAQSAPPAPTPAQTQTPAATQLPERAPLFAQPLTVAAYTSRMKGQASASRVELSAQPGAVQTSIVRDRAMSMEVQVTLSYWNALFLIGNENRIGGTVRPSSRAAKTLTIVEDQWSPLRVGSSISVRVNWDDDDAETIQCGVKANVDARSLNAALTGKAWQTDCQSTRPSAGPAGTTRTVHYFIEEAGFDFVGTVDDVQYELVGIERKK